MANTVVMEKAGVSQQPNGNFVVSVRCVVNDGVDDIFDEVISAKYNPNAPDLDDMKSKILSELRDRWDTLMAETSVNDAAAFDTALAEMQSQAQIYVNQ